MKQPILKTMNKCKDFKPEKCVANVNSGYDFLFFIIIQNTPVGCPVYKV